MDTEVKVKKTLENMCKILHGKISGMVNYSGDIYQNKKQKKAPKNNFSGQK